MALGRDFNGNAFTTADYVGTAAAASLPFIPGAFGRFAGRRLSKLGGLVPFNKLDDTIDAADDLAHNLPGPRPGGGSASRTPSTNVGPSKCPAPNKQVKELPSLDSTGKVHGDLPHPKDFGKYSPEDLRRVQDELRQSVQERIRKTDELGRHRPHGQRQGAEQDLIDAIGKYLSGS